jgi:hypothetical protein
LKRIVEFEELKSEKIHFNIEDPRDKNEDSDFLLVAALDLENDILEKKSQDLKEESDDRA